MQMTHAESTMMNETHRSGVAVTEPTESARAVIRSERDDFFYSDAADYLEYGEG
jgi:hypothetical protein